jgi:hypothetical protein
LHRGYSFKFKKIKKEIGMQRKRLFSLFVGAVLVLLVSFGFLTLSNDGLTTAASFAPFMSVTTAPLSDYLGTWFAGTPIPSPGSNGGAGVGYSRNDTCWLYSINGDVDGTGTAPGQFRLYNITTNTWSTLPSYTGRAWVSAAKLGPVSNTNIYVFGGLPSGITGWENMTGTLQQYNINTNTWTMKTSAPVPAGSAGFCGYQDSLLYAVGGQGSSSTAIANVQLYNANTDTWRAATPLPIERGNGWMVIKGDTIYYGCGTGSTISTFGTNNNNIFVGVISQTDRANITWTNSTVTYPGTSSHRMDAALFGRNGIFIGPGCTGSFWGPGTTEAYTWQGGSSAFVSVGPTLAETSDAQVGTASFERGDYTIWKAVIATGLLSGVAPYHILNTQVYTDSCLTVIGIGNINTTVKEYSLSQNYPNPFNPSTRISFNLQKSSFVKLIVFDILGHKVATLVNEVKQAGSHSIDFNASSLSSGIYFYKLESNGFADIKRMMLVK